MKELKERIKKHEGYSDKIYKDSVGVLTCGWGHALHEGSKVSERIADLFFENDFKQALANCIRFINQNKLNHLNSIRRCLLVDMIFNLGIGGLQKFKRFIKAMQDEDYDKAAEEMLDSKWHKQVGYRAITLAKLMREGVE